MFCFNEFAFTVQVKHKINSIQILGFILICLFFTTGHFHTCILCKEYSLFPFLILGSVFSDCVVFYGDYFCVASQRPNHYTTRPHRELSGWIRVWALSGYFPAHAPLTCSDTATYWRWPGGGVANQMLRKIITFSVRMPENKSYVSYPPCAFFSIGAYLFTVLANAEYHYAIKTAYYCRVSQWRKISKIDN